MIGLRRRRRLVGLAIAGVAVAAAVMVSCAELPTAAAGKVALTLTLEPLSDYYLNDTIEVVVEARDPAGNLMPDPPIQWEADPGFGDPGGSGGKPVLLAADSGRARIFLRSLMDATVSATVREDDPFFTADPVSVDLSVAYYLQQFDLVGVGDDTVFHSLTHGSEIPIRALDQHSRSVSGHRRAMVRGDGILDIDSYSGPLRITALANGTDTVFLSFDAPCAGDCADTLVVTVEQVPASIRYDFLPRARSLGDTIYFVATVRDSASTSIPDSTVSWGLAHPEDSTILAVDTAAGVMVSRANGSAWITGSVLAGAVTDSIAVTVEQAADSVSADMPRDTLLVAQTDTATFLGVFDARGNPIPAGWITQYSWAAYDYVATINGSGPEVTVTAVHEGGTYFALTVQVCGPWLSCSSAGRDYYIWVVTML